MQNFLKSFHPSYNLVDIQPVGFEARVTGMDFLSDGRLVLSTRESPRNCQGCPVNGLDNVYLLNNVIGGSLNNITIDTLIKDLDEPMGLVVHEDKIYVIDRNAVWEFDDRSNRRILTSHSGSGHAWSFGLVYQNERLHGSYGGFSADISIRGDGFQLSLDGIRDSVANGLRHNNGWGLGPEGIILTSDQQGDYLPASKMLHVQSGNFYGFGPEALPRPDLPESPPVVYFPEGLAGNSPSQPIYVNSGIFAGQILIGDIRYPNLHRVFVEKVNGEWQGALFHFAGGIDAGVNRMAWGPDGHLYLGQIGQIMGNCCWSIKDLENTPSVKEFGLKRMEYNGKKTFEIKAVRSLPNGFEIEFTDVIDGTAADNNKYRVESWHYDLGKKEYGGLPQDSTVLQVNAVAVQPDNKSVHVNISGLQTGKVIYITLNNLNSAKGDTLWNREAWYTLNSFGPGEQVKLSVQKISQPKQLIFWKGHKDILEIYNPYPETVNFQLLNTRGESLQSLKLNSGSNINFEKKNFPPGIYMIQLKGKKFNQIQRLFLP